jgi:hypothetical protein
MGQLIGVGDRVSSARDAVNGATPAIDWNNIELIFATGAC